jgi:outer membrane usher protein
VLPRGGILLAAALALAATSARGEEEVAASSADLGGGTEGRLPSFAPVWLDLVVNQVSGGTVLVQLGDGDAWVAEEDLAVVKLDVAGQGERVGVGGRSLISLRSLAPRLTFEIDERALALRVSVAETLLGRTSLDLSPTVRPAGLRARGEPSAFLNWGGMAGTNDTRSASTELGLSADSALLLNGATMDAHGKVIRGLTTGYFDDPVALVRYAAGDVVATSGDSLGGTALLAGAAAWREFSLDPYMVRAPLPRGSVFASTPSTLEVWVNDGVVRRVPVAPGTVDLENLPIVAGANDVRTVLRDAFGREQTASTHALLGSNLLAPRLVDWGAFAGFRRQEFGVRSFDYGGPVAVGRVRAGLSSFVTAGARLEVADRLLSAGAQVALATSLGELDAMVGTSAAEGGGGAALAFAWRRPHRRFNLGAELRFQSNGYANVALAPGDDRALVRATGIASTAVAQNLTLLFEGGAEQRRDVEGLQARTAIRAFLGVGRGYQIGLSMVRSGTLGHGAEWGIFTSLSTRLPGGASGEASASATSTGSSSQVSAQRPLPPGPGVGYRVVASAGDGAIGEAMVQAQGGPGRVEARYEAVDPWSGERTDAASVAASGGLVFIRGKVFASLPVDGSYAVVSVPGVNGVTAFLNNQEVGRTDADGDLLIPGLTPHLANRLAIRDTDVPLEYRVSEVERVVAPTFRGGTVERFGVEAMRAVSGKLRLRLEIGTVVPEWGEVAVETPGKRIVSPIGRDGAFWLDELPSGTVEALIRWEGRLCRFTLSIPVAAGVSDVGTIDCNQLLAALGGSVAAR